MPDTVFYDKDGQGYTPADVLSMAGGVVTGELVLTSPDDSQFRIIVGDDGVLDTEPVA